MTESRAGRRQTSGGCSVAVRRRVVLIWGPSALLLLCMAVLPLAFSFCLLPELSLLALLSAGLFAFCRQYACDHTHASSFNF